MNAALLYAKAKLADYAATMEVSGLAARLYLEQIGANFALGHWDMTPEQYAEMAKSSLQVALIFVTEQQALVRAAKDLEMAP